MYDLSISFNVQLERAIVSSGTQKGYEYLKKHFPNLYSESSKIHARVIVDLPDIWSFVEKLELELRQAGFDILISYPDLTD
jgi:hypothetical protein